MGRPDRFGRGADPALVPLFAGGRARRGIARPNRGMDRRPPRPAQGGRNPRTRCAVGEVVAVSPFGRPLRADFALGIGRSSAGAKDLACPRRRVDPERPAGRLGQPFRPIRLRIRWAGDHHHSAGVVRRGRATPHAGRRKRSRLPARCAAPGRASGCVLLLAGTTPYGRALVGRGRPVHGRAAARPDRRYRRRHFGFQSV